MFKKEGGDEIETVIGPSVHVEGTFIAHGDVVVEGTISGSFRTERNLRVGTGAKIFADVTAANAIVAGEIQGEVRITESLELTSTGKIFGDVKTKVLAMGAGATLQGRASVGEEKKARLERIEDKEKAKIKDRVATAEAIN